MPPRFNASVAVAPVSIAETTSLVARLDVTVSLPVAPVTVSVLVTLSVDTLVSVLVPLALLISALAAAIAELMTI